MTAGVLARAAVFLVASLPAAAERWQLQYSYDQDKSALRIADLQFPSASRGVAAGALVEGNKEKPVVLVTSDGGATWALVPVQEAGISLFFLNDSLGWMVTAKGIWRTADSGRRWTRLPEAPRHALRVWFVDEQRGFAAGAHKGVFETSDGGAHWSPVAAAAKPSATPDYSAYTWIQFATPSAGIIAGLSLPPARGGKNLPAWMDPAQALKRRETPHLSFLLQTVDGGKTWHSTTTSMMGQISRIRFGRTRYGLWLIEFGDGFSYPSEVYRADSRKTDLERVYRTRDRAITDAWLTPSGEGYLAGVEAEGPVRAPVPSRVKVLRSGPDLTQWSEMEVDYRAQANRVILAGAGDRDLWIATDTGIILKLEP
jgi:photosystem II stability/assembly factor-like uncharacterized protein